MANPTISQITVGSTTYDICDSTARNNSLDTISQNSTYDNSSNNIGTENPVPNNTWIEQLELGTKSDKNNAGTYTYMNHSTGGNGQAVAAFGVRRYNESTDTFNLNSLYTGIDTNLDPFVTLSYPVEWRKALGAGSDGRWSHNFLTREEVWTYPDAISFTPDNNYHTVATVNLTAGSWICLCCVNMPAWTALSTTQTNAKNSLQSAVNSNNGSTAATAMDNFVKASNAMVTAWFGENSASPAGQRLKTLSFNWSYGSSSGGFVFPWTSYFDCTTTTTCKIAIKVLGYDKPISTSGGIMGFKVGN